MRIRQCKLGYPATINGSAEVFWDAESRRVTMTYDKGMLTISSDKGELVLVPQGNIAFLIPYKEEIAELLKAQKGGK